MARSKHKLSPFSLSFLDIMSCGFGAVVLLFLIIKHNVDAHAPIPSLPDQSSEVSLLEKEILDGQAGLVVARNTLEETDHEVVTAEGLARQIMQKIRESAGQTEALAGGSEQTEIEQLKAELLSLEQQLITARSTNKASGQATRSFSGRGDREYVTGLKLGGDRIVVLLDSSASMLDDTIVNVIRRRNMSDAVKRSSAKWQQAIKIVNWLSTRFPVTSQYQILTFNTDVKALNGGDKSTWLKVSDRPQLNANFNKLSEIIPSGGTSLEKVFAAAAAMRPRPDNIYLITDGLPTQGLTTPRSSTVSGQQRLQLFEDALKALPGSVPVNVILSPMEGDPMAASAFWQLALITQGSFLSPSSDWP
jgi:hypothetical protein